MSSTSPRPEHDAPTIAPGPDSVPPPPPSPLAAVGDAIDRYRLLQPLGEGGFGQVWLAEQREPVRRRVALKLLKPGMDSVEVLARFDAERQALALMDHPNIAKVLDAGLTPQGRPFFAMEYVPGLPITTFCDQQRMTPRDRLALFIRVCQAVQHAHQKAIIHRDLKPANILVVTIDGVPEPKIIDFGIAKALTTPLTTRTLHTGAGRLIGTPEYMAPEQAGDPGGAGASPSSVAAIDVDTRADIYSLGVVLYELLTGVLPLDSRQLRSAALGTIWKLIAEQDPPRPSTRLADAAPAPASADVTSLDAICKNRSVQPRQLSRIIRGDLDWIVMKCLEKDRSRRYDSAAALAQDIQRHLDNQPVSAGPPTAAYQAAKFFRRHRAGVTVAAAMLVLVVAGFLTSSVLYARAERQRLLAATEAARSQAALDFVRGMFSAIDPTNAQGREISVREVLDQAAAAAPQSLKDQPAVETIIREIIGETYALLGRSEEGRENLQRALDLVTTTPETPDDARTLAVRMKLAIATANTSRREESLEMFRDVHARRARLLGEDHPDTLQTLSQLAAVLNALDRRQEAIEIYKATVAGQTRALGRDARDTLDTRCGLVDAMLNLGRIDEAAAEAESLVADARRALGENHPVTLTARSIQAAVYEDQSKYAQSAEILTDVVERKRQVFGPSHHETLVSEQFLAAAYEALGKFDDAEKIHAHLIEESTRQFGPDAAVTLAYVNTYAQLLRRQKRFDQAIPLFERTLEAQRRVVGVDSTYTLSTMNNLGLTLLQAGKPERALPILEECLGHLQRVLPAGHWMIGTSRTTFADCLSSLGRHDDAVPAVLAGYDEVLKALGPENARTGVAAEKVLRVLRSAGREAQAAEWQAKNAPPAPPK